MPAGETTVADLRDAMLELDQRVGAMEGGIKEAQRAMMIAAEAIRRLADTSAALAKRLEHLERRGKLRAVGRDHAG